MADEQNATKFLSEDSWDYICRLLKTEFTKYTPTANIPSLFDIFKTVEVTQGEAVTNIVPKGSTDTLKLVGGTNVTITPDASTKTITFASADTTYTLSAGTDDHANQLVFTDSNKNTTYITVPYATHSTTQDTSDSSTKIATTKFVHDVVATVTGLSLDGTYDSLEALKTAHPVGSAGVIYLVKSAKPSTSDACDEYYWNSKLETPDYEFFGTTAVNLDGYLKKEDAMTTAEIQAAWDEAQPFPTT